MQEAARRKLLISDANILIDISVGGLLGELFRLNYEYGLPDVLFEYELQAQHPELPGMGLQILTLAAEAVDDMMALQSKHHRTGVSTNDCMALALARQEQCSLLTGDGALRQIALAEGADVKGTVWLVEEMLESGVIDVDRASQAYQAMKDDGSRLPWSRIDQQIKRYRQG
jgi:predicted nucleic acid-binding protein